MLGRHRDRIPSPAEELADHLSAEGVQVALSSTRATAAARSAEIPFDIVRLGRRCQLAVVLVYSGPSFRYAEIASAACRAVGMPMLFWLHGGGLADLGQTKPERLRSLLAHGARVVVPSSFLGGVVGSLGLDSLTIPNLVDPDRFRFHPRPDLRPRLLWMRSFVEHCRPELAVQALAALVKTHPSASMTMAGADQGRLTATRELASELGLADRVRFPGFVTGEDKLRAFETHDVLLHTNSVDNAPISLLEAASSGLAIVGCSVGGVAELLEPPSEVLLSRSGKAQHLADLVATTVDDTEATSKRIQRARGVAEACSWSINRRAWLAALSGASSSSATDSVSDGHRR